MNKQLAFPVRKPQLRSVAFSNIYPDKIRVIRDHPTWESSSWLVVRGHRLLEIKPSQPDAIAWTQTDECAKAVASVR